MGTGPAVGTEVLRRGDIMGACLHHVRVIEIYVRQRTCSEMASAGWHRELLVRIPTGPRDAASQSRVRCRP